MTTFSDSGGFSFSTTAFLRASLLRLDAALTAIGMVRTSDTGQIDYATVTTPAISTAIGYVMYRTDDSFRDVYIKFSFNTGNTLYRSGVAWQIGFSTNGAGTINVVLASGGDTANSDSDSNSTVRAVGVDGCQWLEFHPGGQYGTPFIFFAIMRYCDASGAPLDTGLVFYHCGKSVTGTKGATEIRYDSSGVATTVSAVFSSCLIPGLLQGALPSGDIQLWKHYTNQPDLRPNPFVLTRDSNAVAESLTKSLTVSGTTRTYVAINPNTFKTAALGVVASANAGLLLVWQ